jgi:hypothetical protein
MPSPFISPSGTQGDDSLQVSIAVPDWAEYLHPQGQNGQPLLHVVVRNASEKPLQIWAEDCSTGNSNLTLEVLSLEFATLTEPVIVYRRPNIWGSDQVHSVTLAPVAVAVRAVLLHQYQEEQRPERPVFSDAIHYVGFPVLEKNYGYQVRLRAVFTSWADQWVKADRLWVGRAVSEEYSFRVWGPYR